MKVEKKSNLHRTLNFLNFQIKSKLKFWMLIVYKLFSLLESTFLSSLYKLLAY